MSGDTLVYCHPGSADSLMFVPKPNMHLRDNQECWIAEWDGWRDFEPAYTSREGYYRVWQYRDEGWDVSRPDHPILGNRFSNFRYTSRDYAMKACAEDFVVVARLWRWYEHMKTQEPPTC